MATAKRPKNDMINSRYTDEQIERIYIFASNEKMSMANAVRTLALKGLDAHKVPNRQDFMTKISKAINKKISDELGLNVTLDDDSCVKVIEKMLGRCSAAELLAK